jgi:hypothetical protein
MLESKEEERMEDLYWIRGSYSNDYEDYGLLGYNTMQLRETPTFRTASQAQYLHHLISCLAYSLTLNMDDKSSETLGFL